MNEIKNLTFDDLMALRKSTVTVLKDSQRTFRIIDMEVRPTADGSYKTGGTVLTCDFEHPPSPVDIRETLDLMEECSSNKEYLDRSSVYNMEYYDSFELEPLMASGRIGRLYFVLPRITWLG